MKRLALIPFLLFVTFLMAFCGTANSPVPSAQEESTHQSSDSSGSRYLVIYASRSGNTERAAKLIQTTLDCNLLEIEPETPYESDYNAMLERARVELASIRQGNYPPVRTEVNSFENYDIIFIGYPIWFGEMATPMQSFLHAQASKLAGKRIAVFATSGSSSIATSVEEARTLCPETTLTDPALLLTSSDLSEMDSLIPEWLQKIGVTRK